MACQFFRDLSEHTFDKTLKWHEMLVIWYRCDKDHAIRTLHLSGCLLDNSLKPAQMRLGQMRCRGIIPCKGVINVVCSLGCRRSGKAHTREKKHGRAKTMPFINDTRRMKLFIDKTPCNRNILEHFFYAELAWRSLPRRFYGEDNHPFVGEIAIMVLIMGSKHIHTWMEEYHW